MRLLFDCRYTRLGRHDGISRFTAGLVGALAELTPVTMLISDERQLEMLPNLPWVMGPSPTSVTEPFAARILNKLQADVVFTPMQTLGPWGRRFGLITTVHDLIYYENRTPPRNLPWPIRLVWRLYHLSWGPQRLLLRSSDAHVAVSATTRELMLSNRLTRHPIAVVSNAVDEHPAIVRTPPTTRSIVYMGTFMPYKNVELLARGMHQLPGYSLKLLSTIGADDRARLEELAPAGSLEFLDGVSDEAYVAALHDARALVTASLNEGFGLPLIEAMAQGTPIVVSDIPIFREVGADAADYFDPHDPQSFADAILRLEDDDNWMWRSRRSVERAATYTWRASAATLLTLIESVRRERGLRI
jgi:glycosyltransferase involved in cell wall biosynthesis